MSIHPVSHTPPSYEAIQSERRKLVFPRNSGPLVRSFHVAGNVDPTTVRASQQGAQVVHPSRSSQSQSSSRGIDAPLTFLSFTARHKGLSLDRHRFLCLRRSPCRPHLLNGANPVRFRRSTQFSILFRFSNSAHSSPRAASPSSTRCTVSLFSPNRPPQRSKLTSPISAGGASVLLNARVAGIDSSEAFFGLHRSEILIKYQRLLVGKISGEEATHVYPTPGALSLVPNAEPAWLTDNYKSPYFTVRPRSSTRLDERTKGTQTSIVVEAAQGSCACYEEVCR